MGLCQRLIFRIKLNEYNQFNPYNLVPRIEEQAKKKKKILAFPSSMEPWLRLHHSLPLSVMGSGLPQWLSSKESACNAKDTCLIPRSERSFGEEHGYTLRHSFQENPMIRGASQATGPWSHKESATAEHTGTHGTGSSFKCLCCHSQTSSSMEAVSHSSRITPWAG